jgi:diguanylate cyclase (GGDEF)-like protein
MLQHRRIVLGAVAAVTLLFAAYLPRLVFSTSVHDLIIEDLPETRQYEHFKSLFGSEEIIRIVVTCDNVFDAASMQKIGRLAEDAAALEGIDRVISLPGIKQMIDPTSHWTPEQFKAVITAVPLFERNLISPDGRTTAITLVLGDPSREKEIIAAVNSLLEQLDASLASYQIGMPIISQALARFTEKDFFRLPPIAFLLIAIVLLVLLRRPAYVLASLASVTLALIWTFGAIAMTGATLSILAMIVPVFLIAVGTAYCLHIIAEHRHRMLRARSGAQAVLETYAHCTFPTVLAVATTIFGLGSLLFNRIAAIKSFALFACGGMGALLVILMTFLPVALSLTRPLSSATRDKSAPPDIFQRVVDGIVCINLRHQKIFFSILGTVVLFFLFGMLRLRVETNPVGYFKPDTAVSLHFHDIYQHLSGSFPVNVEITGPSEEYFQSPEHIAIIDKMVRFAETLPGVDKAIAFSGYLKLVNYASNRFDPAWYRLPEEAFEVRMLINSYRSLLGQDMLTAFMDAPFARTNILLLTHISSSRDFLELRHTIEKYALSEFSRDIQWNVTGFGIVISASSLQLTLGQLKSLSITMLLVFGSMFMLFLSRWVALAAIAPNLFPIVVNFGIMGWLGIELSMATSLISGIAVGLVVDDTIHYLVRFNREFKKDLDDRRALQATMNRIGRPVIYTTLTISIGFSALLVSGFNPTAVFGFLMVTTMLAALVGDLLLLPALMRHLELVTLWDLARVKLGRDPSMEIDLFKGLSRTEVHSILMAGALKSVSAGQILFRKGDPSTTIYAVLSGCLEVIDYDGEGQDNAEQGSQKHINFIGAGEIVGEMGMLRAVSRSATVIAREPGELLPINWKMIRRIQWLYPPTAMKLFKNVISILCGHVERLTHCLAHESRVDDLTGLCNRNAFCDLLEMEVQRACRLEGMLRLLILEIRFEDDVDHGNHGGRVAVLSEAGRLLATHTRRCDHLGRIDGQRFAVLVNHTSGDGTGDLSQRMLSVMATLQSHHAGTPFTAATMTADVPLEPEKSGALILSRTMDAMQESS